MLIVPAAIDTAELATLPADVRSEVREWHAALATVTPPVIPALEQLANRMGVSLGTCKRRYYRWAKKRDWRALIDRSRCPVPGKGRLQLHPDLVEYWQQLLVSNQRKGKPAYRELVRRFRAGVAIPGVPASAPRNRLPEGWSYGNLMRYQPDAFTVTAFRIGRSAARAIGPMVYTTRANLWVGSHYLFDDMVHDHFVNILDTRQTGRPVEFHALDLHSACKFAWGMSVRRENELTGKMETLKEADMRFLLAHVMSAHGYSQRGTQLVVEHGTAAVREDLEQLLFDLTGGQITVGRSGIEGDPAFIGQYGGRSKGNFRFKAALESLGNLIHNEMGFLPGQTGMDVDRRPEQTHGLLKHNDALLDAMTALAVEAPERAAWLRFPILSKAQFEAVAADIYRRINARTDHQLEGWDLKALPDPFSGRMRRMSPQEVWDGGHRQLTALPPESVAMMLWRDSATERAVNARREIEFRDSALGSDVLRFRCEQFMPGEKFAAVCNPYSPEWLYLFDARGRYVTRVAYIGRVDRGDQEAVQREMGRVNKDLSARLAEVTRLGRQLTRERIEQMRENLRAVTPDRDNTEARREAIDRRAAEAGAAMVAVPDDDFADEAVDEVIHVRTHDEETHDQH